VASTVALVAVVYFVPWRSLASSFSAGQDDRPPWILLDGQTWSRDLFPELYSAIGSRYGGDGKTTFRVPGSLEGQGFDMLANEQAGQRLLFRCISTRKLEDGTPPGTIAWCAEMPKFYPESDSDPW
jgi:hypothetical protein